MERMNHNSQSLTIELGSDLEICSCLHGQPAQSEEHFRSDLTPSILLDNMLSKLFTAFKCRSKRRAEEEATRDRLQAREARRQPDQHFGGQPAFPRGCQI